MRNSLISEMVPRQDRHAILALVVLNRLMPPKEIKREWRGFGWRVVFNWRARSNLLGRFGGGWNWQVGVQLGGSTMIVNLLICSLRFARESHG